jgi:hypothetical protein
MPRKNQQEIPKPQPGKYPIIFSTTTGTPVKEVAASTSWQQVDDHATRVLDILKYMPEYNKYLASVADARDLALRNVAPTTTVNIEQQIRSTFPLVVAQNMVRCARNNGRSIQGLSWLDKTELTHIRALREIATQYGYTENAETGVILVNEELLSQARKGVRLANSIRTTNQDTRNHGRTSWLPISVDDKDFYTKVRHLIFLWLRREDLDFIYPLEDETLFVTATPPPWKPCLTEDQWKQIVWAYTDRPNTEADWVKHLNKIPDEFYVDLPAQRPVDNNGAARSYTAADTAFGLDHARLFSEIADKWERIAKALDSVFHVAGTASCSTQGTYSQIGTSVFDHESCVAIYENQVAETISDASLAICFPPTVATNWHTFERHARTVELVQLQDVLKKWTISTSYR